MSTKVKPPTIKPMAGAAKNAVEARQQRMVETQTHQQVYEGPIPHPDILAGFERLVPGSAQELMAMAKLESEHRRKLEADTNAANIAAQKQQLATNHYQTTAVFRSDLVGQVCGVLVAAGCIGGAVFLALNDREIAAVALAAIPTAAVVQAFFSKRPQASKN